MAIKFVPVQRGRFVSVGHVDWAGCEGTQVLAGVTLLDFVPLVCWEVELRSLVY